MTDNTKTKIRRLPQEVFYLLTADKATDLGLAITQDYSLNGQQISAMVDLVEKIYIKELHLSDLYTQVKTLFGFDESKTRQFICDLAGYRFLPVSDWLGEDVANYIRSLGGDAAKYASENAELKKLAAADLASDTLLWQEPAELPPLETTEGSAADELDSNGADEEGGETEQLTAEESIEQYKKILSTNLGALLDIDDYLFVQQFNYRLINLLVEHDDLKDALISVLLTNDLKIGTETIVLDGRQIAPTAGAWINYFINQKGSVMFDAVIISDFLVNAASAKFLAPNDKARLSRLLWLYRNLKFFPDSLVGDNPDNWEILTYIGEPNYKFTDLDQSKVVEPSQPTIVKSQSPIPDSSQPVQTTPVPAQIIKAPVDSAKLASLKALAEKYPVGSLERLAINEEIKRLTTL